MAERAVDLERHLALKLKPAAEHRVMLALVGSVLLDRGDEDVVVGAPHAHRLEQAVDARMHPMLVINVARREDVEITAAERGKHGADATPRHAAPQCARSRPMPSPVPRTWPWSLPPPRPP